MRKAIYLSVVAAVFAMLVAGFWVGCFFIVHLAHGDNQATALYGFGSGLGPMIETAILGGGIAGTMWHNWNCHDPLCWRIGRHKVNGTPYCNRHHADARPATTVESLLEGINIQLASLTDRLFPNYESSGSDCK